MYILSTLKGLYCVKVFASFRDKIMWMDCMVYKKVAENRLIFNRDLV